ncbi:MAG: glycosyltransferase family 4 protein [Nitrospinales bacterium]
MRLTLIICNLFPGGAERVLSNMANYWAQKGWKISLLLLDENEDHPLFYELHPEVKVKFCKIMGIKRGHPLYGSEKYLKRLWLLRREIKKCEPQLVISFLDKVNLLVLLSTFGLKFPVIVSERNHPKYFKISKSLNLLRSFIYPQASCLVGVTQPIVSCFSKSVQKRAQVIPNPVLTPKFEIDSFSDKGPAQSGKVVMAMGRLQKQKGFDLLIESFSHIVKKHSDWTLVIWGEGHLRSSLENMRDELGLHEKVFFHGHTNKSYDAMRNSDLFVLSSRHEGFPNVLGEAMACGLPVISFNCPTGPEEIIRDGIDGILVPAENVTALADAMDKLMSDPIERNRLAKKAPEVIDRFALEKVMGKWEKLIFDLIKYRNS